MKKRKPTFWVNVTFFVGFIIIVFMWFAANSDELRSNSLIVVFTIYPLVWFGTHIVIRVNVTNKEIAQLPVLTFPAALKEKIKEDHRNSSIYFLSFQLGNGNHQLIKVSRDVYAAHTAGDTGLLTYKQGELTYSTGDSSHTYTELIRFETT